ncbi:MAG: GGDEF domain-containing protein [Maricaulaceae bacterium]
MYEWTADAEGRAIARQALDDMIERGVSPTPANYELWLVHARGAHAPLSERLVKILGDPSGINQDALDALHGEFLSTRKLQDSVQQASAEISAQVGSVMAQLRQAERNTAAYGEALSGASDQLDARDDPKAVKLLVDGLVAATKHMQEHTSGLERRLQDTKNEVNQLRENLERVREEAMTDGLTGLANRKRFDEALRRARNNAVAQKSELCLMMCDIDHFKAINDTWGHQTGDQIIRFVAGAVQKHGWPEHLAARYGGEEFALIMPDTKLSDAVALAERLRKAVGAKRLKRRSTNEELGHVTISLGVGRLREAEEPFDLLERVDKLLYASKQDGRNRTSADPEPDNNRAA